VWRMEAGKGKETQYNRGAGRFSSSEGHRAKPHYHSRV